jgi:hypothetical protein
VEEEEVRKRKIGEGEKLGDVKEKMAEEEEVLDQKAEEEGGGGRERSQSKGGRRTFVNNAY